MYELPHQPSPRIEVVCMMKDLDKEEGHLRLNYVNLLLRNQAQRDHHHSNLLMHIVLLHYLACQAMHLLVLLVILCLYIRI